MTDHLSDADFDALVRAGRADEQWERHVAVCAACSERLRNEARAELALVELGATFEPAAQTTASAPRLSRVARIAAALGIAAAAALLLFVRVPRFSDPVAVRGADGVGPRGPRAPLICPDGPDQSACVAAAHRHGLSVDYPPNAGPPRYGEPDAVGYPPNAGPPVYTGSGGIGYAPNAGPLRYEESESGAPGGAGVRTIH